MFLVNKRDWDHIPVIILKNLNTLHSISAFQNGRNAFNNGTSTKKDYLIKIDLKDAYLSMPLGKYSRKYTLFQ